MGARIDTEDHAGICLAVRALDAGNLVGARELTNRVLLDSQLAGNGVQEACALLCLAHCDRMASKFRGSLEAATRAAFKFRMLHDVSGEVMALSLQSYAAGALARYEESAESAMLATRLSEQLGPCKETSVAFNYLGLAYAWAGFYDRCDAALLHAARVARQCDQAVCAFQPLQNRSFNELLRLAEDRRHVGNPPKLHRLNQFIEDCAIYVDGYDTTGLLPGVAITSRFLWFAVAGIREVWSGDLSRGEAALDEAMATMNQYGAKTWLHGVESWGRVELALAGGDLDRAEESCGHMMDLYVALEHQPMTRLAYLLTSQVLERRGKTAQALEMLRELITREQMARKAAVHSRADSVAWQFEVRKTHCELMQVEESLKHVDWRETGFSEFGDMGTDHGTHAPAESTRNPILR